jgi:hypothetical protein
MKASARIAPPNSVVLVTDATGGDPPEGMSRDLVLHTPTCIAIGCLSESDGETSITIGRADELRVASPPVFEATLQTPSRRVLVQTVLWDKILESDVSTDLTKVTVWANHPSEPDEIHIALL